MYELYKKIDRLIELAEERNAHIKANNGIPPIETYRQVSGRVERLCDNDGNLSKRGEEWREFSAMVLHHVENYTVPQYGDMGEDQVTNYTAEDCVKAIGKYASRFGTNQREGQETLDLLKIAHYACLALNKR